MLTHRGVPLRRIEFAWKEPKAEAMYRIERQDRIMFTVPASSIGTDNGIDEILTTVRFKAGKILEEAKP